MDSVAYLVSYGWKEGEPLKEGGLKKPILVAHKKDRKGLGHKKNDPDNWWERLFDGQLKSLELNVSADSKTGNEEISFKQNEYQASSMEKSSNPLYTKWFVKGEGLKGTL
ncbi:uncharacterized protein ASCRUDRAFT_25703, partial [Ascoidea rubescens DSM 1968]